MPGCEICVGTDTEGTKATRVVAGTTAEQGNRGEGLRCDRHAPEDSIDIFQWMDEVQS